MMKPRHEYISLTLVAAFLGAFVSACGGDDRASAPGPVAETRTLETCACDPDQPQDCNCTVWTCQTVPEQFRIKVHCTASVPDGGGQAPGSYRCDGMELAPECPGAGAPGDGAWACTATSTTLTCDRGGGADGAGGAGGAGGSAGGGAGGMGGAGAGGGGWTGCTRTQGYWKNHEERWPVSSLDIGGVTYPKEELLALFRTETGGDASLILGHQLFAALLNGAAGTSVPADVSTATGSAQAWMRAHADADGRLAFGVASATPAGQEAVRLSAILDGYNNGNFGPAHCD